MLISAEIFVALVLEIATPLTGLAMTLVVVTRLRRFEQNAKLKFRILWQTQQKLPLLREL